MANISRTPDAYQVITNGSVGEWNYSDVGSQELVISTSAYAQKAAAYLVQLPTPATVTAAGIEVLLYRRPESLRYTCELYDKNGGFPIASQSFTKGEGGVAEKHTFSFTGLSLQTDGFFFSISIAEYSQSYIAEPKATATYTALPLTVSPSPATVYDIDIYSPDYTSTVKLTFGNRIGQSLRVVFKYNSTAVWTREGIDEDNYSESMSGFFDAAGATGSSITVRVEVSDESGRTANASFTLIKPQGSTATPTAPKNTTVDGTLPINFAWSVSGSYGDQVRAELQYSTDNAAWVNLATITGSAKSWTAPKLTFPGGTIYWRVRVRNDFGVDGPWSSSVSFTARYDAVSQVKPVNSQTSGAFTRGAYKTFQVALEASGQVYTPFTVASAVFHWRAGTSGIWTDVAMVLRDDALTAAVTFDPNTFPAGIMQWYAEATDNTGRTTQTPEYTLTVVTSVVDVLPVRPINTVESGDGEITFSWGFVSLDGLSPASGEWRWSADGSTWHTTSIPQIASGDGYALTVPPDTFPGGTVYWQARAQNSSGVWGAWSEAVSFKVLDAPKVEGVTGDGKPFLTISWQTPTGSDYGQQAYKIEVDGKLYGPFFGADARSYTFKEPLEDGPHTVKVAAQNRFGLWSEWAEGNVDVENVPGPAFSFVAAAQDPAAFVVMIGATIAPTITRQPQDYQRGTDGNAYFQVSVKTTGKYGQVHANITTDWEYRTAPGAAWQAYTGTVIAYTIATPAVTSASNGYEYRVKVKNRVGAVYSDPATFFYREPLGRVSDLKEGEWPAPTGYFLIYRDGELIGKTYENGFIDMAAVGSVSYDVIQVLPGGYYTRGTAIVAAVDVTVEAPTLIPLGTTNFLPLSLSEDPRRVQDIRREAEVVYTQFEGAVYPEAEIGEHETLSASGDCAWTWEEKDKAAAFESYLKKPVIYKTPGGERVVGVLTGYTQKDAHFYRTARFSIQQMDWRDFTDES